MYLYCQQYPISQQLQNLQQQQPSQKPTPTKYQTPIQSMHNLLTQHQSPQPPKLSKTKQLQNPYQSTTTTTSSEISRIFLLNNRNKVKLTEESESQEDYQPKRNFNRIVTFEREYRDKEGRKTGGIQWEQNQDQESGDFDRKGETKIIGKQSTGIGMIDRNTFGKTQPIHAYTYTSPFIQKTLQPQPHPQSTTPQFNKIKLPDSINKNTYSNNNGNVLYKHHDHHEYRPYHNSSKEKQSDSHVQVINNNNGVERVTYIKQTYEHNETKKYYIPTPQIQPQLQSQQKQSIQPPISTKTISNPNNNPKSTQPLHRISIKIPQIPPSPSSSNPNSYSYPQSQSHHHEQQQIAQQQNIDSFIHPSSIISKQFINPNNNTIQKNNTSNINSNSKQIIQIKSGTLNKPALFSASKVISHAREQEEEEQGGRGSIIDKIREDNFMESRVMDPTPFNNINTMDTNKKQMTNQKTQTKPRRIKIFGDLNSNKKPQSNTPTKHNTYPYPQHSSYKQQQSKTYHKPQKQSPSQLQPQPQPQPQPQSQSHQSPQQKINHYYNIHNLSPNTNSRNRSQLYGTSTRKKAIQQSRQSKYGEEVTYTAVCPHTQCILKSLEIIDKLTNGTDGMQKTSRKQQYEQQKQQLEMQCLDLCMQVDRLLAELTLPDLLLQPTTVKISKLKYQIQHLITNLKTRAQQANNSSNPISISKVVQNRWQLHQHLQKMLKSLHYLKIVQQRYKMWKLRLHHLSQRIRDILKVGPQQQIQKLNDICQHIEELENGKFYGSQVGELGLVEAYNEWIGREKDELRGTVQWVRNEVILAQN